MGNTLTETERAELEQLRAMKASMESMGNLRLKVSEKGALSIYGLGRFPVTLYRGQWEKLIAIVPQIKEFIAANDQALATKTRE